MVVLNKNNHKKCCAEIQLATVEWIHLWIFYNKRKEHFNILKTTLLSSSLNWSYLFHIKATQKSQISTKLKGMGSILHKYGSFSNSITAQLSVKHSLIDNWALTKNLTQSLQWPSFYFCLHPKMERRKNKVKFSGQMSSGVYLYLYV